MKRFFSQKTTISGLAIIGAGIIHGLQTGDIYSAAIAVLNGIAVVAGREAINKAIKNP